MRMYLSGPITNTTDYLKRFAKAERKYALKGYEVINPAKVCNLFPKLEHSEYMQLCMPMLQICDTICLLKGWEDSEGAKMELAYAFDFKYDVAVD